MKKIAFIIFYFGDFPWYYDLFINSCERNGDIDFLFFSDNFKLEENSNSNIKKIKFSVEEFNVLATKKLNFEVFVENGYKICDFRPAFGTIFEDYIEKYDFWGYTDIDIVLGNIRNFFTTNILKKYDFVSVKPEYPTGYFALFRNIPKINNLYALSKDFKMICSRNKNMLFEECGGVYDEVIAGINILDSSCPFETFYHVLEKNKTEVRTLFEHFVIEGTPGKLKLKNKTLSYSNKFEVLLYHLSDYKKNLYSKKKTWENIPLNYSIGIFHFSKDKWIYKVFGQLYDYLVCAKFKFLWSTDWLISRLISRKINLRTGVYEYMQIRIYIYKENNRFFIQTSKIKNPLKKSIFYKNYLLSKKKNIYYKTEGNSPLSNSLIEINSYGNIIKYSALNNDLESNC